MENLLCATCLQIQKEHPELTARELSSTGSFEATTLLNGTAYCNVHLLKEVK